MNYEVVDERNRPLAQGRDLGALRKKLGNRLRGQDEGIDETLYRRDGLTTWTCGDIPEVVSIRRTGLALNAFPALSDEGDSVSLKLFDSSAAASASLRRGLLLRSTHLALLNVFQVSPSW